MKDAEKHWLVRHTTIRYLWLALFLVLALTLIADLFVSQHDHFGWEDGFGFHAWYGFLTCIGMVAFAKVLGVFLKRRDDYYVKPGDRDE